MHGDKLILSNKGGDTTYGRGPSPILADGRMLELPIPKPRDGVSAATSGELSHDEGTYFEVLLSLGYRFNPRSSADLDTELIATSRPRDDDGTCGRVCVCIAGSD